MANAGLPERGGVGNASSGRLNLGLGTPGVGGAGSEVGAECL